MGFTHSQATVYGTTSTAAATTLSVVLASAPTIGDVVCVGIDTFSSNPVDIPTVSGVKDANNNTYTKSPNSPSTTNQTTAGTSYCFYWIATGTPSATITVTFSTIITGTVEMWADDFGVSGGTSAFDQDAAGNGTGNPINTPSFAPRISGELYYAHLASDPGISSFNSPWTGNVSGITNGTEYILSVSTTTNPNCTQEYSGAWDSTMMAFYISSGGGSINPVRQMMMGVGH
jgi:hypothetical protein